MSGYQGDAELLNFLYVLHFWKHLSKHQRMVEYLALIIEYMLSLFIDFDQWRSVKS